MPITKNFNRQSIMSMELTVNVADVLGLSGVAQSAFIFPPGAIVVGGAITKRTVFNSATSDTLSIGDAALATRYLSAADIKTAVGLVPLTVTGFVVPNPTAAGGNDILVTWTGVGAIPTTGQVHIRIDYIQVNRGEFTQE